MKKILTKKEIAEYLAENAMCSSSVAVDCYDSLMELFAKSLTEGYTIRLQDICSLELTTVAERKGRNPKTGEDIVIPGKKKVKVIKNRKFERVLNG